ncbi:MAG: hypothetical protein HC923_00870 [Myxococcales bacterium]|nr:hypothetical protein [Myxococcales bacterium]
MMKTYRSWALAWVAMVACGDGSDAAPDEDTLPLSVWSDPGARDFEDPLTVVLVASREARIFYTRDGAAPSSSSLEYKGPIRLTDSTLLTFIAVDESQRRSAPATEYFRWVDDRRPAIVLPPRHLEVSPDRLLFLPAAGVTSEQKIVELRSVGTEAVTVLGLSIQPAPGATTASWDPEAFRLVAESTDPVLEPGEVLRLEVTYETTRTTRSAIMVLNTDAQNTTDGTFVLPLFGRLFL